MKILRRRHFLFNVSHRFPKLRRFQHFNFGAIIENPASNFACPALSFLLSQLKLGQSGSSWMYIFDANRAKIKQISLRTMHEDRSIQKRTNNAGWLVNLRAIAFLFPGFSIMIGVFVEFQFFDKARQAWIQLKFEEIFL
jgi:hypothetical protein